MPNGQDHKLAAAGQSPPVRLFISYSHEDEAYRESLCKSLSLLRRQGIIEDWHDRKIEPGADWSQEISSALANSRIVILLISMDFINSDYCYGNEMTEAIKMHEQNRAKVIPILVRTCDWNTAPFGKLNPLPTDKRPVKSWPDQDEAWTDVVKGIRRVIASLSGLLEVASRPIISADKQPLKLDERHVHRILQDLNSSQNPSERIEELIEKWRQDSTNQGDMKENLDKLDRNIHKIDFVKLGEFLAKGETEIYKNGYFLRLCLFVDSIKMGARWGVKKIEENLDNAGSVICKIEIKPPPGVVLNSGYILQRLIDELALEGIEPDSDVDNIAGQICRTFHKGRQLLIKIHECDRLNPEDWSWVHKQFWMALLKRIDQLKVEERAGISILIIFLSEMPIEDVKVHDWQEYSPDFEKSHEVITLAPLSKWTESEILTWINRWFSHVTAQDMERPARIYRSTDGMPELVYRELKKLIGGPDYAD